MMKLLYEAVRNRLRMRGGPESETPDPWLPIFEQSSGRMLSAPARWLCGITDIGKRRNKNEDGYFLSADGRLWIVADGMGGHAAGEVASALTIHAIASALETAGPEPAAVRGTDRLIEAFAAANQQVSGRSQSDTSCQGMGSTAIAAILCGEALHLCHVGDTRCYHLSERLFRRLTNDHSLIWEMVMSGLMTSDQARQHPHRGRVTQAIGMPSALRPEVNSIILKPSDRVLLCSDGLWEALAEQEIAEIVGSAGSMLELALMLIDRANAASGQDNITAVLYEHDTRPAAHRRQSP